jgi:predicted phage terminase large subunit-like protein
VTAGVGGPITGRGADILIIDDPVKNDEEARSEAVQKRNWEWWKTTARTRVEPGGVVIVMQTRWHEEDLAGKLLKAFHNGPGSEGYEPWDVLCLPAIAESGDALGRRVGQALWPERYDENALEAIKVAVGPRTWASLYQQRPSPEEGGGVKRAWWKYYVSPPHAFEQVIQSWDFALKDEDDSDYSVGQVWGRLGASFFLLHQVRGRWDTPEAIEAVKRLSAKYPMATLKLVEDTAMGPSVVSMLRSQVPGLVPIKPKGSKIVRLRAVTMFLEAGNVFVPDPSMAPWVGDLIEEAAAFPNGSNDDMVDAMSQAIAHLSPGAASVLQKSERDHAKALVENMTTAEARKLQLKALMDPNRKKRAVIDPFAR